MTRFVTRRKIAAAAGAATLATAGIVAYAAWTTSGSGTGSVAARHAAALIVGDGQTSTTLYPTGKADLVVTLQNTNDYNVEVTSIAQGALVSGSPSPVSVSDNHNGCTASTVTFTPPTVDFVIGANTTYTLTLHNSVAMSNSAEDACQGATFTVPVIANGGSTGTTPSATSGSFGS